MIVTCGRREVLEGDKVKDAQGRINKAQVKIAKAATAEPTPATTSHAIGGAAALDTENT